MNSGHVTDPPDDALVGGLALAELVEWVDRLGEYDGASLIAAEQVKLIEHLERVKGAAAAAQARLTDAFDQAEHHRQGTRGVAGQLALARREGTYQATGHLNLARALVHDLPRTHRALSVGDISEARALIVARETECLSGADRRSVDAALAGWLPGLGDRELADRARAAGYALDPTAAERRFRKAHAGRRVTCRPAQEPGISLLTGRLPAQQGIAAFTALRRHAESVRAGGDGRTLDQIMADTLVSRLTGQETATGAPVEVELVMSDQALFGATDEPARLVGYGSIPAGIGRRLVRVADTAWVRRLFTRPDTGELVAMDSRRRTFTGQLRHLISLRDHRCRTPWCDAPIRHIDHVRRAADGGQTSADNGQGLCEACNYLKELPGWTAERAGPGGVVLVRTPAGQPYLSHPPPLPGAIQAGHTSPLERKLAELTAA